MFCKRNLLFLLTAVILVAGCSDQNGPASPETTGQRLSGLVRGEISSDLIDFEFVAKVGDDEGDPEPGTETLCKTRLPGAEVAGQNQKVADDEVLGHRGGKSSGVLGARGGEGNHGGQVTSERFSLMAPGVPEVSQSMARWSGSFVSHDHSKRLIERRCLHTKVAREGRRVDDEVLFEFVEHLNRLSDRSHEEAE